MRARMRMANRAGFSRWLVLLALIVTPLLQGCAQGELELLLNDIKKFYLNGGFTKASEMVEPSLAPESEGAKPGPAVVLDGPDPGEAGEPAGASGG